VSIRALVTGGHGFVAQWAIRAMLEHGWEVTAARHGPAPSMVVLTPEEQERVRWHTADVTRQEELRAVVRAAAADVVLHLAAVSHVPDAANNPGYAYEVNAVGTVRLLAELRRYREDEQRDPVILIVGSAEQYGRHDMNEMPLHEGVVQRPLTLYAASKVAQEVAALQAYRADGIRAVCTRSFSHSGVGHAAHFLLPSLVERALRLPTSGGTLQIGNGDTVRDFLHVRDVVDAYLSLVQHGAAGEAYNVSSAEGTSVRSLAQRVLQRVGRTAAIVADPTLVRSVDVPVQVGDNSKLRRATGWNPRRSRDDIIDDLIHAATH
jgi:GDP-4-dehydro-6-deoxy-D-mannose reductase